MVCADRIFQLLFSSKSFKNQNMRTFPVFLTILFCFAGALTLSAQKSVKYDLSAFTEIALRNDAKLFLKQDSIQSVTVKAKDETLSDLVVEVKDRKLIIRYTTNSWFNRKFAPGDVLVYVSVPQIDQLAVTGSGSITGEDRISARVLDCYVSGSGSIKLSKLKAEKISSILSGSGHLQLAGADEASEFKMSVSGSGGVDARGLKAKNVNVLISGSGNCVVNAIEKLNCKIAGSGNVTYFGNPLIDSTVVGSGSVKEGK
jgi:hypothetical protein